MAAAVLSRGRNLERRRRTRKRRDRGLGFFCTLGLALLVLALPTGGFGLVSPTGPGAAAIATPMLGLQGAPPDFFPIAADYQPPSLFATWKARGINTMIRV